MYRNKLKKYLVWSTFLLVLWACSPMVFPDAPLALDSREAAPVTNTPETVESLESLPTPLLSPNESPTPVAPLPLAPPTPAPASASGDNRIQFPPGGTWVEVTGFIDEDVSKTYVLSAMQGQVMSVSVKESWPFIVEVADATQLLSQPEYERPFWRGSLPATQDYFITLNAYKSGDFTLRVAINPPGQSRQFFDFSDPQYAGTLRYSDEFSPTEHIPVGDFKGAPLLTLELIRTDFLSPVTNLSEAYFLYSGMHEPSAVGTCTQPLSPQESITGQKSLNGYEFTQSEMFGAGAGNIYELNMYRTVIEGVCYEMVLFMHSGNIGNYPPGAVTEFDRVALLGKFEEILSSFDVQ